MNLANKLTFSRVVIAVLIAILLLVPFHELNVDFPEYLVGGKVVVDLKYLIAGVLFVIGSITDFLDGYVARKYNMITDNGKVLDAIADKILVNSVLIMLAADGTIPAVIPVVVVARDVFVNSIKMIAAKNGEAVAAIKSGKVKTASLMIGITLTFFYNLPFQLIDFRFSDLMLLIATVLSLYSMGQYFNKYKHWIFK